MGGYVGDTVLSYIKDFARGSHWQVYTWEPDEMNNRVIRKLFQRDYADQVHLVPYGMWNKKTVLSFSAGNNDASKLTDSGTTHIPVDYIDNVHGEQKITFIKMDIEGAEMQGLDGAKMIIQRDKPKLAISIYHHPCDYYEIPFLIKSFVPEYKLYLRQHFDGAVDTVIYATL